MNMKESIKISIIIPFYKGNQYLERLFNSIIKVSELTSEIAIYEIIIVNESPGIKIILPRTCSSIIVREITNPVNLGIHKSRVNGLKNASGEWILFLDQDDELIDNGFRKQIELTDKADVVVGNGIYMLGNLNKKIYNNLKTMDYLIQEKMFIKIRNLIPSPGECLIKKDIIPDLWKKCRLKNNGADDWFLWLLLFKRSARFVCNDDFVYIHNDASGENLSANLEKMKKSSKEMLGILKKRNVLNGYEIKTLSHAIEFKYNQDTGQLSLKKLIKYIDALFANIFYRIKLIIYNSIIIFLFLNI